LAVVGAAVVLAVVLYSARWSGGSAALVEAADAGLHRVLAGRVEPLRVGESIDPGQTIRSDGTSSATLAFDDGSRIEMRPQSEVVFEHTADGLRVRLNGGGVIVSGGTSASKSLLVETEDATVSLFDTISLVIVEDRSSRVAVIRGSAHVEQKGVSRKLGPGEQMTTNPLAGLRSVGDEISWSRKADAYLAMVLQTAPPSFTGSQSLALPERFEVVSIRPTASAGSQASVLPGPRSREPAGVTACALMLPLSVQLDPGRLAMTNVSVYQLVTLAFGKPCPLSQEHQLLSGPAWIESVGFDIQATLPPGAPVYTRQQFLNAEAPQLQLMLQHMLEDRFSLVARRTSKEVPTYNIALREMGSIRVSADQNPPLPAAQPLTFPLPDPSALPKRGWGIRLDPSKGMVTVTATSVPLSAIFNGLQGSLGRMIVDKTDVKALIDIPERTFEIGAGVSDPAVWTPDVLRKLGFTVEPSKEAVESLVIDRVELPSAN
jgi:uncharacterized protein (TIGR03435 family)